MLFLRDCINKIFFFNLTGLQIITVDQMSLVSHPVQMAGKYLQEKATFCKCCRKIRQLLFQEKDFPRSKFNYFLTLQFPCPLITRFHREQQLFALAKISKFCATAKALHSCLYRLTEIRINRKFLKSLFYNIAGCSTTGKPTRSFATERVSLDSV
jgi:hypothetical protein